MKRVRSQPAIAAKIAASDAAFEERTFLATCEADRAAVIQQRLKNRATTLTFYKLWRNPSGPLAGRPRPSRS
jgi:hypothetical protein